jgi:hypothetical protein
MARWRAIGVFVGGVDAFVLYYKGTTTEAFAAKSIEVVK